jgi:hypothetical protein
VIAAAVTLTEAAVRSALPGDVPVKLTDPVPVLNCQFVGALRVIVVFVWL